MGGIIDLTREARKMTHARIETRDTTDGRQKHISIYEIREEE